MTPEHLLDAMGLLDDSLIQQAEGYAVPRRRTSYGTWLAWAASFAVVIMLGYGLVRPDLGGMSGGGSMPSEDSLTGENQAGSGSYVFGSASQEGNPVPDAGDSSGWNLTNSGGTEPVQPGEPDGASETHQHAIMVDGILYHSTGTELDIEPEERTVHTVTAYINTVPEMDGQTNFSQDLSARYAMTNLGLVVELDGKWILFEP